MMKSQNLKRACITDRKASCDQVFHDNNRTMRVTCHALGLGVPMTRKRMA